MSPDRSLGRVVGCTMGSGKRWMLSLAGLGALGFACEDEAPGLSAHPSEPPRLVAAPVTATVSAVAPERGAELPRLRPADPFYDGLFYLKTRIDKSLEAAVTQATNADLGPALAQVAKRVLVWNFNPRRDFFPGDELELVYSTPAGAEPVVHALWFKSIKKGRISTYVLHKPKDGKYARWYEPDGTEVELRMKHGPINEYEQVTSLVHDGRGHKGVDFKTPVGTPIYAPFDGVVQRKNWTLRGNGLCLDLQQRGSEKRAFLLHLSRIVKGVSPGKRVKQGQLIAYSGNTGRSTAPHLHYQLQRSRHGKVLDPFDFHQTWRARLPGSELEELRAQLAKYSKLRETVS